MRRDDGDAALGPLDLVEPRQRAGVDDDGNGLAEHLYRALVAFGVLLALAHAIDARANDPGLHPAHAVDGLGDGGEHEVGRT